MGIDGHGKRGQPVRRDGGAVTRERNTCLRSTHKPGAACPAADMGPHPNKSISPASALYRFWVGNGLFWA